MGAGTVRRMPEVPGSAGRMDLLEDELDGLDAQLAGIGAHGSRPASRRLSDRRAPMSRIWRNRGLRED